MSDVNGIKVGRTKNTRLVPIDSAKLAAELDKRGGDQGIRSAGRSIQGIEKRQGYVPET